MGDYYTADPSRLNGQPKRTIADYVEQNGILVTRRFDSLAEARRSHRAILLRSEHTQEYDGVSGLLDSPKLSQKRYRGSTDAEEIKGRYFQYEETKDSPHFEQYCDLLDIDKESFKQETRFSIWERLKGFGRAVVADSSIKGKYHVMTNDEQKFGRVRSYVTIENAHVTLMFGYLPEQQRNGLQQLVDFYEQIRNLDNFDPNHCPIMEFITAGDKNYFLQYHRTRDFSPSEFNLDRDPEKGEFEVPFVRGATPPEGIDCKITVCYLGEWEFDTMGEDGSYDFHYNVIFPEIVARKRKVQMVGHGNFDKLLSDLTIGHLQRSKVFKPQVSIIHDGDDVLTPDDDEIFDKQLDRGENAHINLHVTSDGRRAFVRRI